MNTFTIPKTGKPIDNQDELIEELTIALWLIYTGKNSDLREKWARIMIELMNRPIYEPADWLSAMNNVKQSIQYTFNS